MTKTGRNDPCPCGSGRKYKRCCLDKDQAAERDARAAEAAARQPALPAMVERIKGTLAEYEVLHELADASNGVIKMIKAGELDAAEAAARELLVRFPDVHDGYDRLGLVYEARGDHKQAAHCYRQVIDFVRAHQDQYDPDFETTFHTLIEKLDPPVAG